MNLKISVSETRICRECEEARKPCGFNRTGNQTYCITRHHGTCTAGFVLVLLPALILFYIRRKSTKEEETRLKEDFKSAQMPYRTTEEAAAMNYRGGCSDELQRRLQR
ncbi:hypothetical protein C4D60_Mb08t15910 [Musa balbisiana]|uniref:Uncharacterized protein n=1 Tax=Musa balbisiana TaxID=52838 RepID=A0A4S8K436_MUSBA|nr:hypothetical protein C4D60_Mb08t15910 [Musa balbisiana]